MAHALVNTRYVLGHAPLTHFCIWETAFHTGDNSPLERGDPYTFGAFAIRDTRSGKSEVVVAITRFLNVCRIRRIPLD